MPVVQKTGNFLLDLLRGVGKAAIGLPLGVGQDIARRIEGLTPEEYQRIAQKNIITRSTALTPQEARDPLIVPKAFAGQASFLVPAAKPLQGAKALQKILATGRAGATAGGLAGFGASQRGQEAAGVLGGAAIGGALGGVLGAATTTAKRLLGSKTPKTPTVSGAQLKADPFFEKTKQEMSNVAQEIGITNRMSSTQKVKTIESGFKLLQKNVNKLLTESKPVSNNIVKKNIEINFNNSNITAELPSVQRMLKQAIKKLNEASGDNVKLNELKSFSRKEMGNIFKKGGENPTQRQEVWGMIFKTIQDSLDTVSPEVRVLHGKQKLVFDLADEFVPAAKQATDKVMAKLPGVIDFVDVNAPTPITKEGASRTLGAIGRGIAAPVTVPAKLATKALAGINPRLAQILSPTAVTLGSQEAPQAEIQQEAQGAPDISNLSPEKQKALEIINQMEAQAGGGQQQQSLSGYSTEQLAQGYMKAIMAGDTKSATKLKALLDTQTKQQPGTSKPLSGATENRVQLANSGLRALDEVEKLLAKDPRQVLKSVIPGQLGARSYDSAARRSVEGLLRARSGAAVPEIEVTRYMNANLPRLGDKPEDIRAKLSAFRKDLEEVAGSGATLPTIEELSDPDTQALIQALSAQGVQL